MDICLTSGSTSTVAVAVWAMGNGTIAPDLELVVDAAVEGGVGNVVPNNPAWNGKGRE